LAADLDAEVLRAFAATLTGPLILPSDTAFDSARRVWNRAIDVHPAAIVRAADVDDVRKTMEFARASGVRVAVRSGGHSQAGHGTCDGGIVLDLGSFRGITVDAKRRFVRAASGCRVSDVQEATQVYGLATPMGGCPDVGIGGLTLAGGENFLMAKYGAVVDNVLAVEIVTTDGQVLHASADDNPDLFWATRGGGGNFGIATWFEYRLYEIGDVLSAQLLFPVANARETMRRYRDLVRDVPDELTTSGGLSVMPGGPAFFVTMYWCGEREAGERLVASWRDALQPESDNVKWSPYSADLVVPAAPSVGTGVFLCSLDDDVIDVFASAVADAPPTATAVWNDLHGAVSRVPFDAAAFPLRQRGFDTFISVPWESEEERAAAAAWSDGLAAALRPFGGGVYVNNLNESEADRVREAYGAHYDRLARLKAKYDPQNLLRINHNIAPRV
jgi:FAD/FMN-containing dehydrogenase